MFDRLFKAARRGRAVELRAITGGAYGGGYAGNRIGSNSGAGHQSFTVHVRMGNGSIANVTVPDASAIRPGDIVQIDPNGNVSRIQ